MKTPLCVEIDDYINRIRAEFLRCLGKPIDEATELEILVPSGEFRLGRIPCRVIWDIATSQFFNTPLQKRRCGVEFGELTQTQIAQLEYLIQNYAVREV